MLTIYTVFHNRTHGLNESIESVLRAAPSDARIVLVDDCSTDDTAALLKAYAGNHVVFYQPDRNLGFTKAIKTAIELHEASWNSEFIAVHGAGDVSLDGRFSAQLEAMRAGSYSLIACRHRLVTSTGEVITSSGKYGEITRQRLDFKPGPWTHGSVMYRARDYFDCGGYQTEMKYCQDWDLNRRLLSRQNGFVLPECLYEKRLFQDGASFEPKKRLRQLQFKQLIVSGRLDEEHRADTLLRLRQDGIDSVCNVRSPEIAQEVIGSMLDLYCAGETKLIASWKTVARQSFPLKNRIGIEAVVLFLFVCRILHIPQGVMHQVRTVYRKLHP